MLVLSLPDLGIGIIVASFQDFGTLPVSQMSLNVFKRTKREVSGRCFKNWNGYHHDPEMNHGPLRGHLLSSEREKG